MALFIIATQLIALLLAQPFQASNMQAFSNPESVYNPIYYFLLVLAFTAAFACYLKLGRRWIIQLIIGLVIISTLYLVYSSVLLNLGDLGGVIAIGVTVVTAFVLFYYPEWWVIDAVGILMGPGQPQFSASLSPLYLR